MHRCTYTPRQTHRRAQTPTSNLNTHTAHTVRELAGNKEAGSQFINNCCIIGADMSVHECICCLQLRGASVCVIKAGGQRSWRMRGLQGGSEDLQPLWPEVSWSSLALGGVCSWSRSCSLGWAAVWRFGMQLRLGVVLLGGMPGCVFCFILYLVNRWLGWC